jgi:hypothetical protein
MEVLRATYKTHLLTCIENIDYMMEVYLLHYFCNVVENFEHLELDLDHAT